MKAAFVVLFILSGATSLAQTPSTVTTEIYRAVLADPSCSGRGSSPGRDRLVIHRATEDLANWGLGSAQSEVSWPARIQRWFPGSTEVEIQRFVRANTASRDVGSGVIAALGAAAIDERTLRSLERPGWVWDNFYRRYPNSTGYIRLSAIAVEPGQERVLVYCALQSGALGGHAHFYLLGSTPAGWHVLAKALLWES